MHQKELDGIEVETISRARMQRLMQERALAEQNGLAQLARLRQQLISVGARLNDLRHQLYFPDVKGYRQVSRLSLPVCKAKQLVACYAWTGLCLLGLEGV